MKLKSAISGLFTLMLASTALAQAPTTQPVPVIQDVVPDSYRKLPLKERQFYVEGVLDTDRFLTPQPQAKARFAACLKSMTIAQVTDVVDRGLTTLPPVLRSIMPVAVHNAIDADCERRGFKS